MSRWRAVLFAMTLTGAMLPAATAGAQDVDEVVDFVTNFTTPCSATAVTPVILAGFPRYEVQGGGGGSCGATLNLVPGKSGKDHRRDCRRAAGRREV
ncbi:MAG TPA: hypothetical protein VHJ76_07215, partial [Actinomycetota bacterium]|nr:hypothetical protein [Actinomycetota bacterium]